MSRLTLKDFLFRQGLKTDQKEALQKNPKFQKMIESAKSRQLKKVGQIKGQGVAMAAQSKARRLRPWHRSVLSA